MVLNIILAVLSVALLLVSGWIGIKKKIQLEAENAINDAEDTELVGAEKMERAIDSVLAALPVPAQLFVTRDVIETVIQATFDGMEIYAKRQLEKKGGK